MVSEMEPSSFFANKETLEAISGSDPEAKPFAGAWMKSMMPWLTVLFQRQQHQYQIPILSISLAWLGLLVLERVLLHLRLLPVSTNCGPKNLVPLILKLRPQKLLLYFPWMDSTFIVINLMPWRIQRKLMQEGEVRFFLLIVAYFKPCMQGSIDLFAGESAPWTFDPELLLRCLTTLKNQGSAYAPSFDHGVGDPVEDDIFVNLQHKVVIVEGNYLFLDEGVWKDISSIFDEKWFIDLDIEKAMQRVLRRHISTGKPPDVAKWRIDYNDRPNAELIIKSKKTADLVIKSIDFSR